MTNLRPAVAALLGLALAGLPTATAAALPTASPSGPPPQVSRADQAVLLDEEWGDDDTGEGKKATRITGTWQPDHDLGSVFTVTKSTGAQDTWSRNDPNIKGRKLTGYGVTVALVDTGITPVAGLNGTGKVLNGPDLSYESQVAGTRYLDGYGHGTHMAGIIAGRDTGVKAGSENTDKQFVGMAPDARLLNMKVGAADGGVDVSQVIAAIDWVVQHKAEKNVKVLNLSYGTDTAQIAAIDPLAHAVQNAWRAGIVVVVAAGNDGEQGATRLTMPAVDPYVIAVGSSDHRGSSNVDQTKVGAWTNKGTTARRPDLVAPGKSVVSLRVPGSYADVSHPQALVYGETSKRMFRGTGTSQSAAVVSGAAALLLQRNPRLTPDQVKGLLKGGAAKLRGDTSPTQGAGLLNVKLSLELLERGTAAYTQRWPRSTGTGLLELSRGSSHVTEPYSGKELRGEVDALGSKWDGRQWSTRSTAKTSWSGGTFMGRQWSGRQWSGSSWTAVAWTGTDWSGRQWSGRQWSAMTWNGRQWSTGSWAGRQWSSASWAGRQWSGDFWATEEAW